MAKKEDVVRKREATETKHGKMKIVLPHEVTAISEEQCRKSLVVKVISEKYVGYGTFLGTLKAIWRCKDKFYLVGLGTNFFQVLLASELVADRVLLGCMWYHDSQILIIKKWKPGIEKDGASFNIAPVWVQVWNFLLNWYEDKAGDYICSFLGNVLKREVLLGGSNNGKILRCLVELDLTQPLFQSMYVEKDGIEVEAVLKYENLSLFCSYCGIVGHKAIYCDAKLLDQKEWIYKEELFGPDLIASSIKSAKNHSALAASFQSGTRRGNSPPKNQKSSDVDEGMRERKKVDDRWVTPEVIISKGQCSSTSKGKEVVVEEVMDEQPVESLIDAEESRDFSSYVLDPLIVEEYISPAPSTPEILILEWHSTDSLQDDDLPVMPSIDPIQPDAVDGVINDGRREEMVIISAELSQAMADNFRKRKFTSCTYKDINFTDCSVNVQSEESKESGFDEYSAEITEPFEKKLKIVSTPELDEGVEAGSPKWLPPSQ